jgi:predicted permease
MRLALGAGRGRLVQQLLVESLWLAAIGSGVGLLLMFTAMQAIRRVPLPLPLPLELRVPLDGWLIAYTLGLVVLATLFSGLLPALQATRPALASALKQELAHYLHRRWTLRGLLVTGQVAVSLVLLATALLFLRNLARTQSMDPGFDTTRTLVAQMGLIEGRYTPYARVAMLDAAVDRLEGLPGIERAAFSFGVPLTVRNGRTSGTQVTIDGEGEASAFQTRYAENMVSPGYFQTLGIPMLKGRDFTRQDGPGSGRVVVVNQAFVERHLAPREPLGMRLMLPGATQPDAYEIVGVVGNGKHRMPGEAQMAAVYFAYAQRPGESRFVHVLARARAAAPETVVSPMSRALVDLDPTAAVDVQTMRGTLAFAFLPSRVGAALLGTLGGLGLTLAMAGLFAMLSYSVTRRTREIGVRMALGASTRSVARLVAADAAVLVGLGALVGLGLAALVTRPLAMFLVTGLSPSDPLSFAGTTVLFALVSAAATWIPTRRAARVDPVVALREE